MSPKMIDRLNKHIATVAKLYRGRHSKVTYYGTENEEEYPPTSYSNVPYGYSSEGEEN